MQSKEKDGLIFVRLFPGEDIYRSLREVCRQHNVETAVVLSGVGQLKRFKLGYFREKGDYTPEEFAEPHELLSLNGSISNQQGDYNFHLHVALGNEAKEVVGGHLLEGEVEVTNEIILLKTDLTVTRKLEASTGLKGMFLEQE
jgi:predicted DNA-binding protein with PD1-like motif